uniref:Uncharacterized protein n=1 Tax=Ascaris lumbricoides TaxID=6252 RepID=A0A0M3IJ69_ASCLU
MANYITDSGSFNQAVINGVSNSILASWRCYWTSHKTTRDYCHSALSSPTSEWNIAN